MIYGIGGLVLLFLFLAPAGWIKYVMWKHSKVIADMPGTGGELAQHLIERFELDGVSVEQGGVDENYYSPEEKRVVLCPRVYAGKSLTAVAVAAHEVGHAIQFVRQEPVSQLREKYLGKVFRIRQIGAILLSLIPVVGAVFKIPALMVVFAVVAVITMLASVAMYMAILPEEYDASFNKALPILEQGYVPTNHMPAARQVLKAAAYTYVAAALADVLRLWRWVRFLR